MATKPLLTDEETALCMRVAEMNKATGPDRLAADKATARVVAVLSPDGKKCSAARRAAIADSTKKPAIASTSTTYNRWRTWGELLPLLTEGDGERGDAELGLYGGVTPDRFRQDIYNWHSYKNLKPEGGLETFQGMTSCGAHKFAVDDLAARKAAHAASSEGAAAVEAEAEKKIETRVRNAVALMTGKDQLTDDQRARLMTAASSLA